MNWKNLPIGRKILIASLGCSISSLAVAGYVSFRTANQGMAALGDQGRDALSDAAFGQLSSLRDMKAQQVQQFFDERQADLGTLVDTVSTLQREALAKLTAVRQIKRSAVERYFQNIQNQMITFSEDEMVTNATRQLRQAFSDYRNENNLTDDNVAERREILARYYHDEFGREYASQNDQAPQVDDILARLDGDAIALQYSYIAANPHPLGSKLDLDAADGESTYNAVHRDVHPIIRNYLAKFGYYDIFLCDAETGDILYTVFKELDFATSLIDGPYADTNIGEAFRLAQAADDKEAVFLVDYARYAPSYEAPASFIASPIYDGDEKIGVAIFQMPIDRLNTIMNERDGLGETGETYLIGADHLMRSDSFLDPDNHSVVASFRAPETGAVNTVASTAALGGETNAKVIIDYNGNPVLSAYCPVKVGDMTWALMAEIDIAEAMCPKTGDGDAFFERFSNSCGYYDLFLVNPDGYCFYTVAKEADYQTNLVNGKYADSGLGRAVRSCLQNRDRAFSDFAPYEPSNGAPAAFIAAPIINNGAVDLIVALQLSDAAINAMMASGADKSRTLEAYLVGGDGHMRSDSILHPEKYSIAASFGQNNTIDTQAVRSALSGQSETQVIDDYTGERVLCAWSPLDILGAQWALVCQMDEEVAFDAVQAMQTQADAAGNTLRKWALAIAAVLVCFASIVSYIVARGISRPVIATTAFLKDIAQGEGDLTKRLDASGGDELGEMARWFNQFVDKLHAIVVQIATISQTVAGSATELSSTASQLASGAEETNAQSGSVAAAAEQMSANLATMAGSSAEMSSSVNMVAAAVEEMTASIAEVAKSAEHSAKVADDATSLSTAGNESIRQLSEAADAIGKVIETIQDIAAQTNLLALNATIEAARAGDAGKGFSVVAHEVKELARLTTEATEDIRKRIEGIQTSSRTTVTSLDQIGGVIHQVNDVARTIAAAVEEQHSATSEIARNIGGAASASDDLASRVNDTATAANEISGNIAGLDTAAQQTAEGAAQTQTAGAELSRLGEELASLVGRFKV